MPSVLGLDLASHTGFSVVSSLDGAPKFGWWDAPKEAKGVYQRRFSELMFWLEEMHEVHKFDAIGFEAPILLPHDKINTPRLLMGFTCVVETFAGLMTERLGKKFPCREVSVQTVKRALTLNPYASKSDMKHAAIRRGWAVADADQADAGAVGITVYANLYDGVAGEAAV